MLIFKSLITKNLTNKNIKDICSLKETHWKFGLNSQFNYFKKNVRLNDLHNCCFFNNKLIGYTLLKKNRMFCDFNHIYIRKRGYKRLLYATFKDIYQTVHLLNR